MTGTQPTLAHQSSLVVTYQGIDPHFHRRDPDQPNRPVCQPIRDPGVLTPLLRARDLGLIRCRQCWPEDADDV